MPRPFHRDSVPGRRMCMATADYLIGLGSNRPHGRYGRPAAVLQGIIKIMADRGLVVRAVSRTWRTPALGPSYREFANAAALIESDLPPPVLLSLLKRVERDIGRRGSRRWGARVIDLDILAWSGGTFCTRSLTIPHTALAERHFALGPAADIAPHWRHPLRHVTLRQLAVRLAKRRPVDRTPPIP